LNQLAQGGIKTEPQLDHFTGHALGESRHLIFRGIDEWLTGSSETASMRQVIESFIHQINPGNRQIMNLILTKPVDQP
jgi:hypothetical protein